ncbi:hypothetical protein BB561_004574 [Smittium simulii]|uniref:U3 small nucleolar RNA-associated protein 10 n=1 Tax=Smittium simulii TaxID=133385 RepID=A0A2T9YFI9_9FUNG|nr:hypothetical protein BB561_004574 [Smittium simulii]
MSLSQQLQKIQNLDRLASTRAALAQRASYLFDSKRAADLSVEDIYEIGIDGFNQLVQLDPAFFQFSDSLFSAKSKHVDRLHQTKPETEKINSQVQLFLIMLAPHFLTNPAGKALEWLIRRFRIEEFNSNDLIAAMLPYHNTKAFLTILTVARIDKKSFNLLAWLLPFRKSRQLLVRYNIVIEIKRNKALFAFINNFIYKSFNLGIGYETLYTFYSAINTEYIDLLPKIEDDHIMRITPYIFEGLATKNEGVQVANYLILCSLSDRVIFAPKVFEKLMIKVIDNAVNSKLAGLCLLKFCQNQKIDGSLISSSLFHSLATNSNFWDIFNEISSLDTASVVLEKFLLVSASNIHIHNSLACEFINRLLQYDALYRSFSFAFFENAVFNYSKYWLQSSNSDSSKSEFNDTLTNTMRSLYTKFVNNMENAISMAISSINKMVSSSETPNNFDIKCAFEKLYELACTNLDSSSSIHKSFKSLKLLPVQSIGTSLYIGLNNALPNIRLASVKQLHELIKNLDFTGNSENKDATFSKSEVSDLILERFLDDEQIVLDELLEIKLYNYLEPLDLINSLKKLISDKSKLSDKSLKKIFNQILNAKMFESTESGNKAIIFSFDFILDPTFAVKDSMSLLEQLVSIIKDRKEYSATIGLYDTLLTLKSSNEVSFSQLYSKVIISLSDNILKPVQINQGFKSDFLDDMYSSGSSCVLTGCLLIYSVICSTLKQSFYLKGLKNISFDLINVCIKRIKEHYNSNNNSIEILKSGNLAIEMFSAGKLNWEIKIAQLVDVSLPMLDSTSAIFTLISFISNLNKPKNFISNNWFQYSPPSTNESDYDSYCKILNNVFISCLDKNSGMTPVDGLVLGYLYEKCFQDEWLQFLIKNSLLESSSCRVRAWSLLIVASFLQASVSKASDQVVDFQILFPALLANLSNANDQIRMTTMSCFKALEKIYSAASVDSSSKSKKHSNENQSFDLPIYKSSNFYGNSNTDIKFLPSNVSAEIVKAINISSNEFESNKSFTSIFLSMINGNSKASTKVIRKLYTSGYGNAFVSVIFSHALCLNVASQSSNFIKQFEYTVLENLSLSITESNSEVVQQLIHYQKELLTSHIGMPESGSIDDNITRKCLSFFNKSILNSKNNNINGDIITSTPWEQYLALVGAGTIDATEFQTLEKTKFENWKNSAKAAAYLQSITFDQLSTSASSALELDQQGQILGFMLTLSSKGVLSNYIPGNSISISQVLNSLNLSSEIFANQLISWISKLKGFNLLPNVHSTKKSKTAKKANVQDTAEDIVSQMPTLVLLLELLSSQSDKIKCHISLITPLFEILEQIFNIENTTFKSKFDFNSSADNNEQVSIEYLKQLSMTLLLNIFNNASDLNLQLQNISIRVDIVVNLLRSSTSLQTQTNALLLLASIAAQNSEIVLHHVMSIFTFMGDSVLRLDDSYNLYVIQQAVEKIIPPLLKNDQHISGNSLNMKSKAINGNSTENDNFKIIISVLRVFIDSLTYIPQHRRLPLFKLLIETIGCEKVGSTIYILLLEKYTLKNSKKSSSNSDESAASSSSQFINDEYFEFAVMLALEFDFKNALNITSGIFADLMVLPSRIPTEGSELSKISDILTVDITRLNTKQQIMLRVVATQYVKTILVSTDFKEQIKESDVSLIDTTLESIVLQTFEYIVTWQSQSQEFKQKKLFKQSTALLASVTENTYSVIDSLVVSLEYSAFMRVIHKMLVHANIDVVRKSMDTLIKKTGEMAAHFVSKYETEEIKNKQTSLAVLTSVSKWQKSDISSLDSLADVLPVLINFLITLPNSESKNSSLKYPVDIIQSSILCISAFVQHFGILYSSKLVQLFDIIFGKGGKDKNACLVKSQNHSIQLSLFVLITKLVQTLETRAIQFLPKMMPILLGILEGSIQTVYQNVLHKSRNGKVGTVKDINVEEFNNGTELLAAGLAVFETIADKWSNFLGPHLSQIFNVIMDYRICYLDVNIEQIALELEKSKEIDSDIQAISKKDIVLLKRAINKYNHLLSMLGTTVQTRVSMEALFERFESLQNSKEQAENLSYSMYSVAKFNGYMANSLQGDQLSKFSTPIFKLFLVMFNFNFSKGFKSEFTLREAGTIDNSDGSDMLSYLTDISTESKNRAEGSVLKTLIDSFIDFCVKLNESGFVPMFMGLLSWATTEQINSSEDDNEMNGNNISTPISESFRLVIFYMIVNKLFDRLQNIFTPYYRHIIDTTVVILNEFGVGNDSEESLEISSKNLNGTTLKAPNKLWALVLESLRLSGSYDSDDLWSAEQFEKFVKPLSSQVGNTLVVNKAGKVQIEKEKSIDANNEEGYVSRVKTYLGPAIAQLYIAVNNDAMWRQLHHAVLLKSRSQTAYVRMGSMIIVKLSFEKLAEEFLILVPETIQFLAELIDDENNDVERTTNETIVAIEGILGESLKPYFN